MKEQMRYTDDHQGGDREASGGNGAGHMAAQETGFTLLSAREVPLLGLTLEHWRHAEGADHYHLRNDDPHRAFSVSFRTIPTDSTGMPHILEHLVLSGSERFPVRDPFFLMLRRSLQTFMNAMTGPDCTYYPFSSQVEKDFYNLLNIYLDAVFQPNLNLLDFMQEGHRLEPEDPLFQQPAPEDWRLKGVVYNEMKGAMGNEDAQLYQVRSEVLVPETPYRHNSGGEPEVIPTLTHQDLVDFHRTHYTGANACFVTYGDLEVGKLHRLFTPYLEGQSSPAVPLPQAQPRLSEPIRRRVSVPLREGQDVRDVSIASLIWLLPADTRELQDVLLGELLEQLLLGHAGSPLRKALESSGLGRALGPSGFGNFGIDPYFSASLKGVDPADFERFEPLVMDSLGRVRDAGFGAEEIAAALHQLELDRRTISGDRFPFGLELAVDRVTEAWRQGTDPYEWLDDEAAIAALRERIAVPGFWRATLDSWLLENSHRALLLTEADPAFNRKREEAERAAVLARANALSAEERTVYLDRARALKERQDEKDDVSVLPELQLTDVPEAMHWVEGEVIEDGLNAYVTGTNGILHQVAALPLGPLSTRQLELLPLLVATIGNVGVGDDDYAAWASHLHAVSGGLSAWIDLRADPADARLIRGFLILETCGLSRKSADFAPLLARTLLQQRFDEHARLMEIVRQGIVGYQQQVNWSGHILAQKAAMRGFGGRAGLEHDFDGLGRLAWLKSVADAPAGMAGLADELSALLALLRGRPVRLAVVGDAATEDSVLADARAAWQGWARPATFEDDLTLTPLPGPRAVAPTAFTTATQVNYCGLAYPAVPLTHPDAAALTVAARYMANEFLHTRIRERGGAYGSRAAYSSSTTSFSVASYRDPRLRETFDDMDAGLRWLASLEDDERLLRESILGSVGAVDRPRSPAGEGRRRFIGDLTGYGPENLSAYRARLLSTTTSDIRRVTSERLEPEKGSRAVITSEESAASSAMGWESEPIA